MWHFFLFSLFMKNRVQRVTRKSKVKQHECPIMDVDTCYHCHNCSCLFLFLFIFSFFFFFYSKNGREKEKKIKLQLLNCIKVWQLRDKGKKKLCIGFGQMKKIMYLFELVMINNWWWMKLLNYYINNYLIFV